jgi:two-component system, NarL family, sensor histidine kinase UhpB
LARKGIVNEKQTLTFTLDSTFSLLENRLPINVEPLIRNDLTGLTVLIIEDNPGDAVLLGEYLRMTELSFNEILHASTLAAAFNLAEKRTPDIIFLDLSLPDSKGVEALDMLSQKLQNVPIIVLSGLNKGATTLDAIAAGAQDYLVKGDFSIALLQKSILYSIERKKTHERIRASDERFHAISTASDDAIWDWNLRTGEFFSNDALSYSFGYTKEEVSRGHSWWYENLHKADRDKANESLQKALLSGTEKWQHEYRFICSDKRVKYIYGRGIILRDSAGIAYRLIGIMQDITPVYELRQTLALEQITKQRQLAQATIEGQEKERAELGKELHDNINQLLAATKLYLSMAATKPEVRDEMIGKSITNLNDCMEEIRKLSKALVPPSIGLINLSDAVADLTETMQLGGKLKISSYVDVEQASLSHKQQLNVYRIVQEQLNNILKHAHATQAEVSIMEDSHGTVELVITDNGRGFDTDVKYEGIGLKNIQSRTEILDGTMSISSEKGKGCMLKITFKADKHT